MLKCDDFFDLCKKYDLTFFSGVPDSTFKSWMTFLEKNEKKLTNIITVNECEAVAICAGYHIATKKFGVIYLQNSGLGKTVNPLTSLCDPSVYSIPLLLLIGWRGEPGIKDAYQHHKMGSITIPLLNILDIPYEIITEDIKQLDKTFKKATKYMKSRKKPFAMIVRKNIFEKNLDEKVKTDEKLPSREEAIKEILATLNGDETIVSTTGKTSRELFECRKNKEDCSHDFYNIGAMGCAQSIAFGIALNKNEKKIIVLDGDGALLMQMGAMTTTGHYHPKNFYHIVFDNQSHDSTGGQPTNSGTVDFKKIALASNYEYAESIAGKELIKSSFRKILDKKGPCLIEIKIKKGSRSNLGRPTEPPKKHKEKIMKNLQGS